MIPFPCLEMPQAPRGCSHYHATARPLWEGVRGGPEACLFSQGGAEKPGPFPQRPLLPGKGQQPMPDSPATPPGRPCGKKRHGRLSPAIPGKSQSSRGGPFPFAPPAAAGQRAPGTARRPRLETQKATLRLEGPGPRLHPGRTPPARGTGPLFLRTLPPPTLILRMVF